MSEKKQQHAVLVERTSKDAGSLCIYPAGGLDLDDDGSGYFYLDDSYDPYTFKVPDVIVVEPSDQPHASFWCYWGIVTDE